MAEANYSGMLVVIIEHLSGDKLSALYKSVNEICGRDNVLSTHILDTLDNTTRANRLLIASKILDDMR